MEDKRKRGRPRGPSHVDEYNKLGPPPPDPLEAVKWAGEVLAVAMYKIVTDTTMDERTRRQELRSTAKVMSSLVPAERLLEAERTVRRAAEDMERTTKDAELKDVSAKPARALRIDPS